MECTSNINPLIEGKIMEHCHNVKRGSKPCSNEAIQDRFVDGVQNICKREGCKAKVKYLSEGWKEVWIYLDETISLVIDSLPSTPTTPADHYLLGAVFGYSDEKICEFIKKTFAS